ncbi:MAG: DNA-processing protein DprA [Phycisphaeraceae bacterium]|nr:DNA-processing protein DprA [Phycisphaeraceae bacterium]
MGGYMDHPLTPMLRLTLVSGLSPRATRRALDHCGSAEAVLQLAPEGLAHAAQIRKSQARKIASALGAPEHVESLQRECALIDQFGVKLIALGQPEYPALLRFLDDPPPLLYVRGSLRTDDGLSLGIVGSRRCTTYGREQADRFAAGASQAGLVIISGGALGIDTAAHRAVMRVRGRTIAVIGSGHANLYPPENAELFDRIAADDGRFGAVISELPMTTPPRAENFPARNRIISGLSLGILVIEAAMRSGALITARLANEEHHRHVMAVPGRIDSPESAGCNMMIREGWASLVTGIGDVIRGLPESETLLSAGLDDNAANASNEPTVQPTLYDQSITPEQRKILELLDKPRSLDELAMQSGMIIPKLQADLTLLQIRGLVNTRNGRFARRSDP